MVYGDSKQTTKWNIYKYEPYGGASYQVLIPFILKKDAKVNVNFSVEARGGTYDSLFTVAIVDNGQSAVSDTKEYTTDNQWRTFNVSVTTRNVIPAGKYYIKVNHIDPNQSIKYATTSGTLTNNEYIQVPSNGVIPSNLYGHAEALAKYTITT